MFLNNLEMSVLNFFILPKNVSEKVDFSKILKGRNSLLGSSINFILSLFLNISVHFIKNTNLFLRLKEDQSYNKVA